jgi:hypothetical protein
VTRSLEPGTSSRHTLVAQMRARLLATGFPRFVILLILVIAGLTAFGFSALALDAGLDDMAVRYFVATMVGYGVFLLLIRVWIALRSREADMTDLPDIPHVPSNGDAFGGGQSGGAGAAESWGEAAHSVTGVDVPDADEAWPVVLAAVVLLGGVLAMLYVVYLAPVLLAEVALDAALVTGIYRKLRKKDAGHWLGSAVRHTWLPATIAAVCIAFAGLVLQWAQPAARSIGDVFRMAGN